MINTPKVAVVILNWNGIKHLGEFLPSVLASTWPDLDIIAVSYTHLTLPTIYSV